MPLPRAAALVAVMSFAVAPAPAGAGDARAPAEHARVRLAQAQLSAEDIFWQTIQNSSDPAMFRAYLDQVSSGRFPGTYKVLAEIKISTLEKGAAAAAPAAPSAPPPAPPAAAVPAPTAGASNTARSPDIDACDRAAAAPADKEKPADMPGVTFGSIDGGAAIRACRKAIEVPGAPRRVYFQLARAINKTGNVADALTFYKQAVDLGHPGAMHDLAGIVRAGGRGIKRDTGLAMTLYEKAAAAGVAESLVQLGAIYSDGRSGRSDYPKALEFYRRAADAKTPGAYTNLGVLYYEGRGVPRDGKKACDYWREGAALGDDVAAKNLKRSCRIGGAAR